MLAECQIMRCEEWFETKKLAKICVEGACTWIRTKNSKDSLRQSIFPRRVSKEGLTPRRMSSSGFVVYVSTSSTDVCHSGLTCFSEHGAVDGAIRTSKEFLEIFISLPFHPGYISRYRKELKCTVIQVGKRLFDNCLNLERTGLLLQRTAF